MTSLQELQAWIESPREGQHLEFKEAKSQFDLVKLLKYCVALANEGGGRLILGISDRPPRKVVGSYAFPDVQSTVEKLFNKLRFRVDADEVQHPDGRVPVFRIPPRPVGTVYSLDAAFWMRSGEELVPMSEDRLRQIFDEGKPEWSLRIVRAGLTSDEVIRLLSTQTYFDLIELPYPSTREAVLDRLVHEQLVFRNEDRWDVTYLGAVMFAKQLADFDLLGRRMPRVIVYEGRDKLATRKESVAAEGYAVAFPGLLAYINGQLPTNEIVEQALRRQVKQFPELAIRELVANALIHQDFEVSGGTVMIEIYADRIEISNPGKPFIETDRFIDEYRSRNERLADLARRLRMCEEKGSGIDKVVKSAEAFQLPAPDFRASEHRTTTILFAPKAYADMSREDRVRACYQHCCLQYVTSQPMTNQTLRDRFKLPNGKDTVSRLLRDAVEAGKIRLEEDGGSRRYARYVPFWA